MSNMAIARITEKSNNLDDLIRRIDKGFEDKISEIEDKYENDIHQLEMQDKNEQEKHLTVSFELPKMTPDTVYSLKIQFVLTP